MNKNKALFAISTLWLGHATRSLVVINLYLNKWYEIDIISYWNALNFLKSELIEQKVNFIELEDYPALERWKWWIFYYYLFIDIIKTNFIIKKENNFVKSLWDKYDFIFSDCRYWIYSSKIPSFLQTHQISFIIPKWLKFFLKISDYFNYCSFRKFNHIFIPDYSDINFSIAWKLSHPNWINKLNHSYIWILSSYSKFETNKINTIDYLFTITWYLLEGKEDFVIKLIEYAKKLNWKKVFVLWDTNNFSVKELEADITIYSYVSWEKRRELFANANVIISRAWYTTIMDIIELWKKAILIPTPNQTEQEYLAEFLKEKWFFIFLNEYDNLLELINNIDNSKIFETKFKTINSLEEIDKIILKYI